MGWEDGLPVNKFYRMDEQLCPKCLPAHPPSLIQPSSCTPLIHPTITITLSHLTLTPPHSNYRITVYIVEDERAGEGGEEGKLRRKRGGVRVYEVGVERQMPREIVIPCRGGGECRVEIRLSNGAGLRGVVRMAEGEGRCELRSNEGIKKAILTYTLGYLQQKNKNLDSNKSPNVFPIPEGITSQSFPQQQQPSSFSPLEPSPCCEMTYESSTLRRRKKQKMLMRKIREQLLLESIHQKDEQPTISVRDNKEEEGDSHNQFMPCSQPQEQQAGGMQIEEERQSKQTLQHALSYKKPISVQQAQPETPSIDLQALNKTQSQLGIPQVNLSKIISIGIHRPAPNQLSSKGGGLTHRSCRTHKQPGFISGRSMQSPEEPQPYPTSTPQIVEVRALQTRPFARAKRSVTEGCQTDTPLQFKLEEAQARPIPSIKHARLYHSAQIYSVKVENKPVPLQSPPSAATSIREFNQRERSVPKPERKFDFLISNLSVNIRKKLFGRKRLSIALQKMEYTTQRLHGSHLLWVGKEFLFSEVSFDSDLTLSLRCEVEDDQLQLCRVRVPVTQLILNYRQCYYQTELSSSVSPEEVLGVLIVGYQTYNQGHVDQYSTPGRASVMWHQASGENSGSRSKTTHRKVLSTQPNQTRRFSNVEAYLKEESILPTPKVSPFRMRRMDGGKNIRIGRASRFLREKVYQQPGPGQYKIHSPFSRYKARQDQLQ